LYGTALRIGGIDKLGRKTTTAPIHACVIFGRLLRTPGISILKYLSGHGQSAVSVFEVWTSGNREKQIRVERDRT
jgi:hypothetical protein